MMIFILFYYLVIYSSTTAAIAIINLILFVLPGDHPTYYQTTTAIIGKIYSNTMMVTLNSRINISKRDTSTGSTDYSTSSNSEMRRRLPHSESSHGEITVTQEQWTTPPISEVNNNNLNVRLLFLEFSLLILIDY